MTIEISDDMKQKLDLAMKAINKEYGPGSLMQPGNEPPAKWPSITTGAPTLDHALGIGGLPYGRIVEIYGPESSGKSTLAMSVVAEAQAQGLLCAYVDAESALDPKYAIDIGMDWENILLSQPDSGEEALNITEDIIKTGLVKVVVVDSVAALTPLVEMEGSFNDQQMGQLPRMMSKAMRKLVPLVREFGVCLIFINQIREKIGVMFGNPETQPGGRALKFAATQRIDVRRDGDFLKSKDGEVIGFRVKAKVIKNKLGPPFKMAGYDLIYGKGIDKVGCVLDMALMAGIFTQSGSFYKYQDETFAQGRANAVEKLEADTNLLKIIKDTLDAQ